MLDIAPDVVTVPLVTAIFRSVLGDTDFSIHLAGPTGIGKTELAALAQQHFGPGLDARHLPGNWLSTGNAIEGLAFVTKDALLVVDRTAKKLTRTAAYYAFLHYSSSIAVGATRVGTTGTNDAVAFKNPDGSIVVQVYNKGTAAKTTTVGVGSALSQTLYQFSVPAHGWATLRLPP